MHKVPLPSLPWNELKSPTGKFHSFMRNVSLALGGLSNTGTWGGGHPFDVQIRRVPPGAAICPFHAHLAQWEFFVVRRGAGTVRSSDGRFPVGVGDVFFHPPGTPHQLINSGREELEVLILADNPLIDGCYYPDSDKYALRPPGKFFRMHEVHYFEGEDALPADAPPYRASPAPKPLPVAPFPQRKLHPDTLPWVPWTSPRGKFHGESKELSLALGAKPDTPPGLGGHPFALELGKLGPRQRGGPFHSHAARWELFIILSGTATVRAGSETHPVHAEEVVLHPPGEAHQIANASDREDLLFFVLDDNPPVEISHYPDSNTWGLRSPRKFFRAADVECWDGEE